MNTSLILLAASIGMTHVACVVQVRPAIATGMTNGVSAPYASADAVRVVPTPPVAPLVETPRPSPGPDYVWARGNWDWRLRGAPWLRGSYVRPPTVGAGWASADWIYRAGGWQREPGRWGTVNATQVSRSPSPSRPGALRTQGGMQPSEQVEFPDPSMVPHVERIVPMAPGYQYPALVRSQPVRRGYAPH